LLQDLKKGETNSSISQKQSLPPKSRGTLQDMIKDNNDLPQNKHYGKCCPCNKLVVYDTEAIDHQDKIIPLDIDRKRPPQLIAREEQIQEIIERANKFGLTFPLELVIDNYKARMMMQNGDNII
jgi:hypothetical protein